MSKITSLGEPIDYDRALSLIDEMVKRYYAEKNPSYAVAILGALIGVYCDITHQSKQEISKLLYDTINEILTDENYPLEEEEEDEEE